MPPNSDSRTSPGQRPIRSEYELRLRHGCLQLAERGADRRIVPTVAIENENLPGPHARERLSQFGDQLDIDRLRYIERTRKLHVVRRQPRPKRRRQQHAFR